MNIDWIVGTVSGFLFIGFTLDHIQSKDSRAAFARRLRDSLALSHERRLALVNRRFLDTFDSVYVPSRAGSRLGQYVWRGILYSYIILSIARLVLRLFGIEVPFTEYMLATALGTAIGVVLMHFAFDESVSIISSPKWNGSLVDSWPSIRWNAISATVACSAGLVLYTWLTLVAVNKVGYSAAAVGAACVGSMLGVPFFIAVGRLPARWFPVSPFRSVASSLLFVGMLMWLFPAARQKFFSDIAGGEWAIITLLIFNLYADALSLIETRLILYLSAGKSVPVVVGLLAADLLASALIFLVLPGISAFDLVDFWNGIRFVGDKPWFGLLFWSTFSTSLIYYVFVLWLLVVTPYSRAVPALRRIFDFVDLDTYPLTVVFGLLAIAYVACTAIYRVVTP